MASSPAEINHNNACRNNRIILYFILVLGIIAVSLWTVFLIQLSQVVQETKYNQQQHINGSLEAKQSLTEAKENVIEAKQNVIEAKQIAKQILNVTNTNQQDIKYLLNNVSDINEKLYHQIIIINKQQQKLMENLTK